MLYRKQDGGNYYAKFSVSGRSVHRSTGTADHQLAQEVHDRWKADVWRQAALKERPRRLWEEAVARYLDEASDKKSIQSDIQRLRWLYPRLEGTQLEDITRTRLDQVLAEKHASAATLNRYTALVRRIMNLARQWEWLDTVPAYRMRREPRRRVRWITREQAARLIEALPEHLQGPARFALATGLRQANVFGLRWDQVDMPRKLAWIHADEAKSGRDIGVPLNQDALAVLRAQIGAHQSRVFTYQGRALRRPDKWTWRKACERAGLEDFRWHDLRHTWASWHVQAGTPLQVLMELGGWSDMKMVLRYAHLGRSHLSEYAERSSQNRHTLSLAWDRDKAGESS